MPIPRTARRLVTLALGGLVGGMLVSCGAHEEKRACPSGLKGEALVLVVPVHRGSPAPTISTDLECSVTQALERSVPISVVTAEGSPRVAVHALKVPDDAVNDVVKKDNLTRKAAQLVSSVKRLKATSDGNDLLASLSKAADEGRNLMADRKGAAQIISLDNGLTDRGAVAMTQAGMTSANPEDAVRHLKNLRMLPPASGMNVTFQGLGYGVPPQPELTSAQRNTVTAIWTAVAKAAGATVEAVPQPYSDVGGPETAHETGIVAASTPTPIDLSTPFRLDDASPLGFVADEVHFRDPRAASALLDDLAGRLKARPQTAVTISGTTSNGPTRWPSLAALGGARAQLVADELVRRGVTNSLRVVGAGYLAKPPVVDPATAAMNRGITLTFR